MALVSITAGPDGWQGEQDLSGALQALPDGAAVTVMVHGFRFAPGAAAHDPHRHILALAPTRSCWKAVSWPRHLHLDRPGAGLGIGFGWQARGRLDRVAQRAFDIGAQMASMIRYINMLRPGVHVNIIAHSLGARVALSALAALPRGDIDRIILLSGAEYRDHARSAMRSPAGRAVQVLNVTSGENAPFDALFRLSVPPPRLTDWPLAAGLPDLPGWTDLRVDCPHGLAALRSLGFATRPPTTRICHWSTYLRPGLFRLYRALCAPGETDLLPRLAEALHRPGPQRSAAFAIPMRRAAADRP